jgi:hypothetical protein
MRRLVLLLVFLLAAASAHAQGTSCNQNAKCNLGSGSVITGPGAGPQFAVTGSAAPCDLLANGCLSAWSVVERMSAKYTGPLFFLLRDDGQTGYFYALPNGLINTAALHSFCDGHDCSVQMLFDQVGANSLSAPAGNQPRLEYNDNGLPTIVLLRDQDQQGGAQFSGGYLINSSTVGLPTTGSRTMYIATDNYAWGNINELFGYAGTAAGGNDGSGFVATVTNGLDANSPAMTIFGTSLEQFHYAYGAYPSGYGKLIGEIKYNQPSGVMSDSVLPSSLGCIPGRNSSGCDAISTFNAVVPFFSPYNTGNGTPNTLRMGQGTDNFPYGGRFQSAALASYTASATEDTAVIGAMASVHFPPNPTKCGSTSSALSASKPYTGANETPSTYYGTTSLNVPNLVGLWGTRLFNPDWNGALFRYKRADTGATFEAYPTGCEANITLLTQNCSGTTCAIVDWYDQSGHNWDMRPPSSAIAPTLSITGMNSKPCVQFTVTSPNQNVFTASFAANPSGPGGLMTVTAVSAGTLAPGQLLQGTNSLGLVVTIVSQSGGTTGGNGTYIITGNGGTLASNTFESIGSSVLMTDPVVWAQFGPGSTGFGLYENMTAAAIWQGAGTGSFNGPLISMPSAWSLNVSNAPTPVIAHNSVNDLVGSTVSANQAHFTYMTMDNSSPQNLVLKTDAASAATGTSSAAGLGQGGVFYSMGATSYGHPSQFCQAAVFLYNDIESGANLTNLYNLAHNVYATP